MIMIVLMTGKLQVTDYTKNGSIKSSTCTCKQGAPEDGLAFISYVHPKGAQQNKSTDQQSLQLSFLLERG